MMIAAVATVAALGVSIGFASSGQAAALAVSAGCIVLASTPLGWWQGVARFERLAAARVLEAVGKAAAGALLVVLGFGAAGALGAFALGAIAVLLLGAAPLLADLRRGSGLRFDRRLWRSAAGVSAVQGLVAVIAAADVVLVALLHLDGPDASAYQASMIIARAPLYLATAVAVSAFPVLSASKRPEPVVNGAIRLFARLLIPVVLVLVTMPNTLLAPFFPETFGSMSTWLRFTAVTGAAIGSIQLVATFFQARGKFKTCSLVLVAGLVGHLLSMTVGYAAGGLAGLAIGAMVGASVIAVTFLVLAERAWHGSVRRRARSLAPWGLPRGSWS